MFKLPTTLFQHGMSYRYKGSGGKKADLPGKEAPSARIETRQEVDVAQRSLRSRTRQTRGREGQIFAGQLTRRRQADDLKLKEILG